MILEESRQQREEARLQTKVLEDQVSKLTSMMEVLLKTRMDMALGGEGVDLSRDDGGPGRRWKRRWTSSSRRRTCAI